MAGPGIADTPEAEDHPLIHESRRLEMRKSPNMPAGTVHHLAIDSQMLVGNLLGDQQAPPSWKAGSALAPKAP